MKKLRLLTLGTVALFSLAACGKTEETAAVSAADTDSSLFAYVPADTPYLLGNLQPPTDEVIDTFLSRIQPVLTTVQEELHQAREKLDADNAGSSPESQENEIPTQIMRAVLQELDGKLDRKGLESLGFDLRSHKVIYGMGAFPVLRLGLSDSNVLRATIQRVMDNAGISAPELNHQGVAYWRLSDGDASQQPVNIYIAILSDHLAIGVLPALAEAELLPAFLGLSMPANSDAAERLATLNAKHGYTAFGSGILDLVKLVDEFITPGTLTARTIESAGHIEVSNLAPQCLTEIRGIVNNTPRMTMGTTELSTAAIALQYRVETETSLAQQLAGLVAEIPMADPLSKRIFEFSVGLRLGAVRDFLRSRVSAIMENPYTCEHLLDINQKANEAFTQLNQPMPPFINNFRGFRMSLNEITMSGSLPENGRGLAAIYVEQPEMFVGMAQMFVPDLSEMQLSPGDPPVQLPASLAPTPGLVAYAALSDNAIGLSIGAGEESRLTGYLAEKSGSTGTFMSANYDMAAYIDYKNKFSQEYQQAYDGSLEGDDEQNAHVQSFMHIGESAQKTFQSFSDRNQVSLKFTSDGMVADTKMTFK